MRCGGKKMADGWEVLKLEGWLKLGSTPGRLGGRWEEESDGAAGVGEQNVQMTTDRYPSGLVQWEDTSPPSGDCAGRGGRYGARWYFGTSTLLMGPTSLDLWRYSTSKVQLGVGGEGLGRGVVTQLM